MAEMENTASSEAEVEKDTTGSEAAVQEQKKLLDQAEVDRIVKRRHHEGYEKGKQEALAEFQRHAPEPPSSSSGDSRPSSLGGMPQMTAEDIRKLINEENQSMQQRYAQEQVAQQIATDFIDKLKQGVDKYDDFTDRVEGVFGNFHEFPEIADLARRVDNTADVIYELSSNPGKIGNLLALLEKSPRLALAQMHTLSKSIKDNAVTTSVSGARDPLSQVKPSGAGLGSGASGIAGLRKEPWLRG